MPINDLAPSAGQVVVLTQVLGQHPFAELRVVPRDVVTLGPRSRLRFSVYDVMDLLHSVCAPSVPSER
jgi:hypothetical protein